MEERPYDPEAVKALLVGRPDIVLHGLDGNHHAVPAVPLAGQVFTPRGLTKRQRRRLATRTAR